MATTRRPEVARNKIVELPGFEDAPTVISKGMVISLTGEWGTGKTEFSLTTPAPIAFIDMDTGTRGVIEKWAKRKTIKHKKFNYRDSTSLVEWERLWEECKKAFTNSLNHPNIRSIVWDTATEGYELEKMARWGKLNKIIMEGKDAMPYPYGPLNAEFQDLLRQALSTNKIVIFIHRMQDEYINKKSTGERIRSGFKDMEFIVEVDVTTWKKIEKDDDGKVIDRIFGLTINKCRLNRDIEGLEIAEPLSTFPIFASQVFPDTSEDDWQ